MRSRIMSPSTITSFFSKALIRPDSLALFIGTTMSTSLSFHAFSGNPIRSRTPKSSEPLSPQSALQTLKTLLSGQSNEPTFPNFKVLPFSLGRPLVGYNSGEVKWEIGWWTLWECKAYLKNFKVGLIEESLVYLGCEYEGDVVYWAVDVPDTSGLGTVLEAKKFCFVELRTLMVATDWTDSKAMGELAVAGHAKALLEWHNTARFCGYCGVKSVSMEAGRRRQCSNDLCKRRIYPRLDPVVIMLVIDKENDRALLSRQSRFVPRMWSCLAGFIEPGESLEEAVRRETWEETGVEVDEVVYHSSQPWPVGSSSMPCQIMIGFFAYAKTLAINVDKEELEDARWHSRDDVKKALTCAEYEKAQRTAAGKVEQMCKGVGTGPNLPSDFNVESGELAYMFIPGPFAIAHHLITSWANGQVCNASTTSLSNL